MNTLTPSQNSSASPGMYWLGKSRLAVGAMGVPMILLILLSMIVLPLPAFFLDVFFTFNITLSLVVILAVVYVDRPLDFNVFPSVLLLATLLRLALNVASTRVVLLNGHTGPDAAGKVIEAFGEFVIGGNYTVGIVVFMIIVIINFVVVTKGAGRISEVTARFTLDSMPGKQMAIDADLSAGMLTKEEAKLRREEVRMEADFYGSMDGASKFVRGDAIAGILILFINIIGGLVIGIFEYDLDAQLALKNYTLLTIGDGLVAQIPSLILSTAVAMIVTRMSHAEDVGDQIVDQMFAEPKVLYACAAIMGAIGIIPGMPNVAFLLLAALTGFFAYLADKKKQAEALISPPTAGAMVRSNQSQAVNAQGLPLLNAPDQTATEKDAHEISWSDVAQTDVLSLQVGFRLIPLVDEKQAGELVPRVRGIRKKLSQDMGFLYPSIHISDNLELEPNQYRLLLQGDEVAKGVIYPEKFLALNPSGEPSALQGINTQDPTFNMPAVWIDHHQKAQAQALSYTVVDSATVVATHIAEILREHSASIFGHKEAQALLDTLKESDEHLVDALVPSVMNLSRFVQVLQAILREQISIKNIRSIAQTLTEYAEQAGADTEFLVARVREALGRMIVQQIMPNIEELPVSTLHPQLEQMLQDTFSNQSLQKSIEPKLAEFMQQQLVQFTEQQIVNNQPAVLLVSALVRPWLARFFKQSIPELHVLSYTEIPDQQALKLIFTVETADETPR